MNTKDYIQLLNKPYSLNEKQTAELERVLSEFPFLQSARAIYLKGLYNQDSFRYNTELKKTAAYTTDRSVLFDFITSEQFQSIEKKLFEENQKAVGEITVAGIEVVTPEAKLEESIKRSIRESAPEPAAYEIQEEAPQIEQPEKTESADAAKEHLNIGKPLEFNTSEKHSFAEWLQLSKLTPVNREEPIADEIVSPELNKKMELIDKFIETNPKIVPAKTPAPTPTVIDKSLQDNSSLMTETLARVYLEQKKYNKAIQAYEILILKYPEKSVFFADRIADIKTLQQNN